MSKKAVLIIRLCFSLVSAILHCFGDVREAEGYAEKGLEAAASVFYVV
ncbi:hypothetical protein QUF72_12270 [Desulfobacterales bacterium HSG2]|nr:hypothetical protein [Desulfobacterales bacterium HSG2]